MGPEAVWDQKQRGMEHVFLLEPENLLSEYKGELEIEKLSEEPKELE